ncbi:MAG: biotin--[acetyl-CoA-carboxylase] ligase [Treponemataceae bacterium]|nr:biotin--[acetyl-CoA-carboxylase] ligase [Treponemataceae bacterium]
MDQTAEEWVVARTFNSGCYSVDEYDILDSSNTECKRRVEACIKAENDVATLHNTVVIARAQTAGRGRLGRSFYSPKDTGIYFSVILHDSSIALDLITPVAAVAVARALEKVFPSLSPKPQIKWVNDVYLAGKKVCGILTEGVPNPKTGRFDTAICGIGINLAPPEEGFPEDIQHIASAVTDSLAGFDRSSFMDTLFAELARVFASENSADAMAEYKSRSLVLGKDINVISPKGTWPATVLDVLPNGHLLIRHAETGEATELFTGEVSIRLREN